MQPEPAESERNDFTGIERQPPAHDAHRRDDRAVIAHGPPHPSASAGRLDDETASKGGDDDRQLSSEAMARYRGVCSSLPSGVCVRLFIVACRLRALFVSLAHSAHPGPQGFPHSTLWSQSDGL